MDEGSRDRAPHRGGHPRGHRLGQHAPHPRCRRAVGRVQGERLGARVQPPGPRCIPRNEEYLHRIRIELTATTAEHGRNRPCRSPFTSPPTRTRAPAAPHTLFRAGDEHPAAGRPVREPGGPPNSGPPGPDVGIQALARRDGDEWVIPGRKKCTPHAPGWDGKGADLLTVACRTDLDAPPRESLTVLAVPGRAHGIVIDKALPITVHQPALVCEISFDEVRVPAGTLLAAPG